MKKVSARFTILCILVLLIGATALAAGGSVSNITKQDVNVTVETSATASGDPVFSITRQNAGDGKLYTVLIRSGAEDEDPSGGDNGNLVYMDMVEAKGGVLNVTKVYPKTMTAGTYRVFMSDYGKNAITQVATFEVGDNHLDNVKLGDVNGDASIDVMDAIAILDHAAEIPGKDLSSKMNIADINKDHSIDVMDAIIVLDHAAEIYDLQERYGV